MLLRRFGRLPGPIRPAVAGVIGLLSHALGSRGGEELAVLAHRLYLPTTFFDRLAKVAGAVRSSYDPHALYSHLLGDGQDSDGLLRKLPTKTLPLDEPDRDFGASELFMVLDFLNYMLPTSSRKSIARPFRPLLRHAPRFSTRA